MQRKIKNIFKTFETIRINFIVEVDDLKKMFDIEDNTEQYLSIKKINKSDILYINELLEQSKKLINKYVSIIL